MFMIIPNISHLCSLKIRISLVTYLFQFICEAIRVEISKMNEETKEWELFEDDDSEFQITKDGDKISFKFNEVFPDDAGKYKVCGYFKGQISRFLFSSVQ